MLCDTIPTSAPPTGDHPLYVIALGGAFGAAYLCASGPGGEIVAYTAAKTLALVFTDYYLAAVTAATVAGSAWVEEL